MGRWTPPLAVRGAPSGYRLSLKGVASGEGETLQIAADRLVARVLDVALAQRSGRMSFTSEVPPPDLRLLEFLLEIAELAVCGTDVRDRVLGPHLDGCARD